MPRVPSTQTLNSQVAKHLPSANSTISLAVRDFIKIILNIEKGYSLPLPPTAQLLYQFQPPPVSAILVNNTFFNLSTTNNTEHAGARKIPGKYKDQCQYELASYGIIPPTFLWNQPEVTPWDRTVLEVIVKHWLHAKGDGAFVNYPLEDQHCVSITLHGLAERWLRGQKDKYQKPKVRSTQTKPRVRKQVSHYKLCWVQHFKT